MAERFRPANILFAFLDDVHVASRRSVAARQDQTPLRENSDLDAPERVEALQEAARRVDPTAVVWRGNPELSADRQGVVVLGAPVGHPEFVSRVLEQKTQEHSTLLERIPAVQDLPSAWVLLSYCAAARANFWLRTTSPEHTEAFAQEHDRGIWRCLCQLLHVDPGSVSPSATAAASLPLSSGGTRLEICHTLARYCTLGWLG